MRKKNTTKNQVLKREVLRKRLGVKVVEVMEQEIRLVKFTTSCRSGRFDCGFWYTEMLKEWCGRNSEQVSLLVLSNKDQS